MIYDPLLDTLLMVALLCVIFTLFAIAATLTERALMVRAAHVRRSLMAAKTYGLIIRDRAARKQP